MKIAVISDIHDNIPRLEEALTICRHEKLESCICCGDVGNIETLAKLAETFRAVYLAIGNLDYHLKSQTGLFPENIEYNENILEEEIDGLNIAIVHHDYKARNLAKEGKYDVIFYGHTHTPWEQRIGKSLLLNPGEITGQFGRASFAIFDTETQKSKLIILK